ncbi:hypothetical protein NIB75_11245 [Bacteroides uniformis]|nr:hypothetical protein [Bacteroides uniformis]
MTERHPDNPNNSNGHGKREEKTCHSSPILLSTLIGTAVLFQWAIVTGLYAPLRNPAMWERLMEKDILFRFLYVILDRRPRFSLSGWQSERRKQEMGLHQYDTGYGIHAGCRIQPVISVV